MSSPNPPPRPLEAIQADIAAATLRLAGLAQERRRARLALRLGIAADFDSGMSRAAIAARWGLGYRQVADILHRAGRTELTRRAIGLSDSQHAEYLRIVGHGVRPAIARAIALREPWSPS